MGDLIVIGDKEDQRVAPQLPCVIYAEDVTWVNARIWDQVEWVHATTVVSMVISLEIAQQREVEKDPRWPSKAVLERMYPLLVEEEVEGVVSEELVLRAKQDLLVHPNAK